MMGGVADDYVLVVGEVDDHSGLDAADLSILV